MYNPLSEKLWSRSFILLCFANLFMAIAFYFLISTLPTFLKDILHESGTNIGLLLASYTLAAIIIRPFAGYSVDFFGRKWLYLISLLFFTILFNFYYFATAFALMFMLRFVHGLVWGGVTISNSTIVVDLIPEKRRGEGLGVFGLSMTLAMAVGPMIGTTILSNFGYKEMFWGAFLLSFIGFIVASLVQYPKFSRDTHNSGFSFVKLFEKSAVPVALGILILIIPYGGLVSFIAIYAKETGSGHVGTFFLFLAIGLGLTRIVSGRVFDRSGPDILIYIATFLFFIGYILLAFVKTPVGFYGSSILIGIGHGILFPVFQAMVNNLVPPYRRGATNSTFLTAVDLGIGIGMAGMGFIYEWLSLTAVFAISAVISLVGFILYITYIKAFYKKAIRIFLSSMPVEV